MRHAVVNPVIALLPGMVEAIEIVTAVEWISCGVILLGFALSHRGETARKRRMKKQQARGKKVRFHLETRFFSSSMRIPVNRQYFTGG